MESIVQLRQAIATYDDNEFARFKASITADNSFFIQLITTLLIKEVQQGDMTHTNQIKAINKNIIDSRTKPRQISHGSGSPDEFGEIPNELVVYTAGFLKLREVCSFMRCNRRIFIACNHPTAAFYEIITNQWFKSFVFNFGQQSQQIQLQKLGNFRMARKVSFVLRDYYNFEFGANRLSLPWMNLKLLHLQIGQIIKQNAHKLRHFVRYLSHADCNQLVLDWTGNCTQNATPRGILQTRFTNLLRIASANPNLETLIMCNFQYREIESNVMFNFKELTKSLPKLKSLLFSNCSYSFVHGILQYVSNQIQTLHIYADKSKFAGALNLCDLRMNGLIEYDVSGTDQEHMIHTLENAKSIQRLHWMVEEPIWRFATVIKTIFQELIQLECMEIEIKEFHPTLLQYLIYEMKGLSEKRATFKLKIKIHQKVEKDKLQCLALIFREFVSRLKAMVNTDFLFTVIMVKNDIDEILNLVFDLDDECVLKYKIDDGLVKIYVYNKGNSMNGYNEQWMIDFEPYHQYFLQSWRI